MNIDHTKLSEISAELAESSGIREQMTRRASDHLAHAQDRIIAKAVTKALGEDVPLESLRGRLAMVSIPDSDNRQLLLDGAPLIEFFPLRISEEHRNGSHFLNLSLPYRLFDWELEP